MQGRGRRHSTRITHKLGRGTCENIEYAYIYIASSVIIDNLKIYDYGHTISSYVLCIQPSTLASAKSSSQASFATSLELRSTP
jgi:hypothetical protein